MNQRILYVGLDVDDTHYHGSALSQETGEVLQFQCRPTLKGLVGQLAKLRKHCAGHTIEVAYEASYIGFTLQRDLASQGYHCDVVAPSRIPRVGGKAIQRMGLKSIHDPDLTTTHISGFVADLMNSNLSHNGRY